MKQTWLQDERFAYPNGGQTRKGLALYPDKHIRRIWAGIPDTFYSIPAHGHIGKRYVAGFLTREDGVWIMNVYKRYQSESPLR